MGKEISVNGSAGETYVLCTFADIKTNTMVTKLEKNGGWLAFFALISKEELASYKFGLGYDPDKLQEQICNKEIETKNLLNQIRN